MTNLLSPAKINIYLHVFPCYRKDKYHSVKSITYKLRYYDYIHIEYKKDSCDKNTIHRNFSLRKISGPYAHGISLRDNTITKTVHYLHKYHGLQYHHLHISLRKNIPHGSGLGGSSSNAGVFLYYLHKKYSISWNIISSCARYIGSDVSLFLYQKEKCHIIYGRGECIKYCPHIARSFRDIYVIIIMDCILSTKKVYSYFRNQIKHAYHFMSTFRNDLLRSSIAFSSSIQANLHELSEFTGCFYYNMTGSGSACFGMFTKRYHAQICYDKLYQRNKNVFITKL